MTSKLIIALDFDSQIDALNLIDKLDPTLCSLKVGNELFTRFGPNFITQLVNRNFKVFLDLKFHDIPNTVAKACKAGADLGVWMLNVHAAGGTKMMQAAKQALEPYGATRPILIAVTVLTSFDKNDLNSIGINVSEMEQVKRLSLLTKESGLEGVVCSAQEVKEIKNKCGTEFITVTPGIRLEGDEKNDQSRVMTPHQALAEGSDYLVIGRSITQSKNPQLVIAKLLTRI